VWTTLTPGVTTWVAPFKRKLFAAQIPSMSDADPADVHAAAMNAAATRTILLDTPTGYDRPFGDGYDVAVRHERGGADLLGPRMSVLSLRIC